MTSNRRGAAACLWAFGFAFASAQQPAEATVKTLKGPPGFEVTLVAAEPMLVNPTALEIDSRGRLWVAEGLNYRFFRNGEFKRAPGADKIKILEDTDGDGKADKVTVFAENIYPVPMGLAIQEIWKDGKYAGCRVFTGNSPDLLCLEDTDGDDKADKRYPLLTGFGGWDSDHGVHGMFLAADGKMYFTQGDGKYGGNGGTKLKPGYTMEVTDKDGRTISNTREGTVLRCNLDGSRLELLARGLRNDYEVAVSSAGDVFASDNDDDGNRGCRTCWIIPGADYGYHTRGTTRHWAEEFPHVTPKIVGTGNGSPCGILVYEGNLLPPECRGAAMQIDAGTRRINLHPLTRVGSGYRTEAKSLLDGADPHYRPIDACTAADGSLYVADWYDAGVGGHRFTDQTTGRIYRLAPTGHKSVTPKPDFGSVPGLIAGLKSPNVTTNFAAGAVLLHTTGASEALLKEFASESDPILHARLLQTLLRFPPDVVAKTLARIEAHPTPADVELLYRRLNDLDDEKGPLKDALGKFAKLNLHLKDVQAYMPACREALLACKGRSELDPEIRALVNAWDGEDRFYLSAMRIGLSSLKPEALTEFFDNKASDVELLRVLKLDEPNVNDVPIPLPPYYPTNGNDAFPLPSDKGPPATLASKLIGIAWALEVPECLPALQQTYERQPTPAVARGVQSVLERLRDPKAADVLIAMFGKCNDAARQIAILDTLRQRTQTDWKELRKSDKLLPLLQTAFADAATQKAVLQFVASGDRYSGPDEVTKAFRQAVRATYVADKTAADLREAALVAMFVTEPIKAMEAIRGELKAARGGSVASPLALTAVSALQERGKVHENEALLLEVVRDDKQPAELRRRCVQALAAETISARRLLDVHRTRKLPELVLADAAYLLNNHADGSVRNRAAGEMPLPKVAGRTLGDARKLMDMPADAGRGRAVFFADGVSACGKCHRVQGVGQWVGPDLSTIGVKYDRKELLYHILQPSGAVAFGYQNWTLELADGRVLAGLIVDETPERIVLKTATGDRLTIATKDVASRKAVATSLMPEKLADPLTDQQIADLLAYMAGLKQPTFEVTEFVVMVDGQPKNVSAGRDGVVDLSTFAKPSTALEIRFAVSSPVAQQATLAFPWHIENATVAGVHLAPTSGSPRVNVPLSLKAGDNVIDMRWPTHDHLKNELAKFSVVVVSGKPVRAAKIAAK